ncbi:MAG: geranylgeranylglycerol-phosphate geranylgeranyltransferase [Saprospiraceae bacterium]|nr:geranylgeranylglycerol-phosphate geranylgeranyltransferase [Saprospiraceae bacterium]
MATASQMPGAVIRLLRPFNLLLIIAIQLVVHHEVIATRGIGSLLTTRELLLVIVMTVTTAAAGYVINDIHDVRMDEINKPGKNVVGRAITVPHAWILYWLLTLSGAVACLLLIPAYSFAAPIIFSLTTTGLWLYSALFKQRPLIGNLMVSLFCALVIYILWIPQVDSGLPEDAISARQLIWAYVLFSFLITLIRELIKDIEDLRGDSAIGARTAPAVWGVPLTIRVIRGLIASLVIAMVAWHVWLAGAFLWWQLAYLGLTVVIPLLVAGWRIGGSEPDEMGAYSTIMKVIVVFGTIYLIIL